MDRLILTLSELTDPGRFTLEEATFKAAALMAESSRLPERLAQSLKIDPTPDNGRAERILELLGRITPPDRLAPLLVTVVGSKNARIRSKACKLYAASSGDLNWAYEQLDSPDVRLSANVVEALWRTRPSDALREFFWRASMQLRNRVAGNGVVGLFLCNDPRAGEIALHMAGHISPDFRATAAWAIGKAAWRPGLVRLKALSQEKHTKIRANAETAIKRVLRKYPEAA